MLPIKLESPLRLIPDGDFSDPKAIHIAILKWALEELQYPYTVLQNVAKRLNGIHMVKCIHNSRDSKVYLVKFPHVCEGHSVLKLYQWPPNVKSIRYKYGQDRLDGELLGFSLKKCPYVLETFQVLALNEKDHVELISDPKERETSSGIILGVFSSFFPGACDLLSVVEKEPQKIRNNVCHLARSIGVAVYTLHKEYGIAHRDIKAKNILILDEKLNLKLIDFGFLVEKKQGNRNSFLGTRGYMDPQILAVEAKTSPDYDPFLADAYSLAVLLYLLRFDLFPKNSSDTERSAPTSLKEMDLLFVDGKELSNLKERFPEGVAPIGDEDAALFDVIEKLGYRDSSLRSSVIDIVETHPFFKDRDPVRQDNSSSSHRQKNFFGCFPIRQKSYRRPPDPFQKV